MAKKTRDPKIIENLQFNDKAHAHKEMFAGFPADMSQMGSVPATVIEVGTKMPVRVVNASGGILYAAFSNDSGMAAPTNMTNGVAIFDGTETVLNSNENQYLRFSGASANAQYVIANDDGKFEV